ncbi:hypothetical protein Lpp189_10785 [Lacticaseibacillus paracasei subsp. paracasei Lpp189]|nr:hypothetical protein Lpp189_10785 [Lacticaseibacillus paracasei subsp. paracasei Lpp189]
MVTTFLIIVIALLMGGVTSLHSFDTGAYEWMYNLPPETHRFEWGYIHMSYWAYSQGIPFATFRLVSYSIFLVILYIAVRRFTPNTTMFFTLFLIFPFFCGSDSSSQLLYVFSGFVRYVFSKKGRYTSVFICFINYRVWRAFSDIGHYIFVGTVLKLTIFENNDEDKCLLVPCIFVVRHH